MSRRYMSTSTLDKPIARPYMPLEEALRYLRRNQVFLCYRADGQVDVWSCGRKLPMALKRSVFKHRKMLLAMMQTAHPRVCPARDLHALEWVMYRDTGREVCLMCAQIGA